MAPFDHEPVNGLPAAARRGRQRVLTGLGMLLLLGACSGDNLFEGGPTVIRPGTDRVAPEVDIEQPTENSSFPLNDSLLVQVRVRDNAGVARLEIKGVSLRGDPDLGTQTEVERFERRTVNLDLAPTDTVVRRFLGAIPATVSEPVFIIVTATDSANLATADTVAIFLGGPRVEIQNPPSGQQLQSGRDVGIRVSASDPQLLISRLTLTFEGVTEGTIVWNFPAGRDTVVEDTTISIPAGVTGNLDLELTALNGRGIESTVTASYDVRPAVAADTARPFVSVAVSDTGRAGRVEMTDSVLVTVTARDNSGGSGLSRIGVTAIGINPARTDTVRFTLDATFAVPRTGTAIREFRIAPFNVDILALPDTLILQLHAFAVDADGNCAAGVTGTEQRLECQTLNGVTVSSSATGRRTDLIVTAGRTIGLPSGGRIADATVDTVRNRLYLSNIRQNKIELLDMNNLAFLPNGISVGSEPWGMFLNTTEDTLIIANSGGTNISFVNVGTSVPVEDNQRRLFTPNEVLYQIRIEIDGSGAERYSGIFFDFSDKPQFVVQDSTGRLLYSTVPTNAASPGSIRVVDSDPVPSATDDTPEVRLLFTGDAVSESEREVALAYIDSIQLFHGEFGDLARIFDHEAGYPDRIIVSNDTVIAVAVEELRALGSDIFAATGAWDIPELAMSDTTFLSASGDRGHVAFGEGAVEPFARIIMWDAARAGISDEVEVRDLINNAAERVTGLGLNRDGSLGVARGSLAAYFFTPDLRLQGQFQLAPGGAGAALHPEHDDARDDSPASVAFVGTATNTVQVIHTFHFFGINELAIRDNIIGPLRTSGPLPGDNQGMTCPGDPNCVVVKLYGVTDTEGVVILNVRAKDLQSQ